MGHTAPSMVQLDLKRDKRRSSYKVPQQMISDDAASGWRDDFQAVWQMKACN